MKLNFLLAILLSLVVISLAAPTKTIEERDYISSRTVEKRDEKPICPTVTPPGEPSCGIGH
ncbi:hypothetical protein RhiirA4_394864 [Rhizophagus irregularis]|jgi:hypothetical protein|uniref:Uncharacterized protein n=1 Tax=Rhizophagus irregularis TaxID=588596 RepID=A0A2I1G1T0_9GLOM|nr:hypothetical protein RhiirA4_394864 [Rhizophagus irregularis]